MSGPVKIKIYLSKVLDDIMQTDMGILPNKSTQPPDIAKALRALNSVHRDTDRDEVKKNLKQAGGKLFSTSKSKGENINNWAIKANLASSCLSLISPNLAIGISDWVCEKVKGDEQSDVRKLLRIWAKFNLAVAYKETSGGRDQTEKELNKILEASISMVEAPFKLPSLIQLCEIHNDRQEKTRFDERKKRLLELLNSDVLCRRDGDCKGCQLADVKISMESSINEKYKSYIGAYLFLLCQEYHILSMRVNCRKNINAIEKKIAERGESIFRAVEIIYVNKFNKHLSNLMNKLYLIVLEYVHETLLAVAETLEQYPKRDLGLWTIVKPLESIGMFMQEIESAPQEKRTKRLFPERFEWWTRILETVIKKKGNSEILYLAKLLLRKNGSVCDVQLEESIRGKIQELRTNNGQDLDLDGIRDIINLEQMRDSEHHDPEVEEHLRQYRKVVGLFNDTFSNDLEDLEVMLIENSVCTKKLKNTDKWLAAQLCARRRYLEGSTCSEKVRCVRGKCLWLSETLDKGGLSKKMNLERMDKLVKRAFEIKNGDDESNDKNSKGVDKPQALGLYLDGVFKKRKTEFSSRLCEHSCHNEMAKGRFGITCLRRWQSFTPALSAPQKVSRGGGYFVFKSKGDGSVEKGVVIDPGLYFLENFFEEGFSIQDIDAVLLTHHHIDHRDDLEALLTLIHEAAEKGAPNNIKLVVTRGAWPDIDSMIRRAREDIEDIFTIENETDPRAIRDIVDSIDIDWRNAYHDCFKFDCVGYRLCLKEQKDKSFLFTGDTVYTPLSLGRNKDDPLERVIMLNLGGVVSDKPGSQGKAWELKKLRKNIQHNKWKEIHKWILGTGFMESHLYLAGAFQLLCDWHESLSKENKTGLAILCELPEELSGGHRKTIAGAIQAAINEDKEKRFVVLPEDVGLRISYAINDQEKADGGPKIECLYCSQLVEPAEIEAIPWGLEERLMFVCRNCKEAAAPYLLEEKFKQYRDRGRPFEKAES